MAALVKGLPNNPIPQEIDLAKYIPLTKITSPEDRETAIRALDLLQPVDVATLEEHRRICPICLDSYKEDTNAQSADQDESADEVGPAVSLPCTHVMCSTCATEWIKRFGTCPQSWCSAKFLISRLFATSLHTQSALAAGKLHTKSPADRAFTLFRFRNFIKKDWYEERASYILALTALVNLTNPTSTPNSDNEAANVVLRFIKRHTLPDIAPDPAARFVIQHIMHNPALLVDRRFGAARYVRRKERERGVVMWEMLANWVNGDVGAEREREAERRDEVQGEGGEEGAREVMDEDIGRVDDRMQGAGIEVEVRDDRLEGGNVEGGIGGMVLAVGAVGAMIFSRVFR